MLQISGLTVDFQTRRGPHRVVDGFSLSMERGEIVGIVGESGSGKTMTAQAVMGLTDPRRVTVGGSVLFDGTDLLTLSRKELRAYQGSRLAMIFQEPMTSLNPVMPIGRQVEEALLLHTDLEAAARRERALASMEAAELADPQKLWNKYPHELSGGMRQRVMIAAALVAGPELLIADEPTTALDVTIQAQILRLLRKINETKHTAILFISHDLGVVRRLCSRVVVMRDGVIVEQGATEALFQNPTADYTKLLISSRPTRTKRRGGSGHG